MAHEDALRVGGMIPHGRRSGILVGVRAAILSAYGDVPSPGEFDLPAAADGQEVVDVEVAGLNPIDVSLASGTFYAGAPALPYVVGREGVGRTAAGARAYFDGPVPPSGSIAARALVASSSLLPVPGDVDAGVAVACGIAGLAAWLALEWRAELRPGETVLVLGAGGTVGRIAVQAAKLLGAGRVVAAGRDAGTLADLASGGADATVQIDAVDDLAAALRDACEGGPNVTVDPVWGAPAAAAVDAAAFGARHVQLGQSAGATAELSSRSVRGKLMSILGHTNFAAPAEVKADAFARMVAHAAAGEIQVEVERVPLDAIADAWARQQAAPHHKLVIEP